MENQRKNTRSIPNDYFLVFERETDDFIGRVMNMSVDGIMLVSEKPVNADTVFHCRMALPERIDDCFQIVFDIECKWCRKSEKTTLYEAGYEFKAVGKNEQEIIRALLEKWILFQTQSLSSLTR